MNRLNKYRLLKFVLKYKKEHCVILSHVVVCEFGVVSCNSVCVFGDRRPPACFSEDLLACNTQHSQSFTTQSCVWSEKENVWPVSVFERLTLEAERLSAHKTSHQMKKWWTSLKWTAKISQHNLCSCVRIELRVFLRTFKVKSKRWPIKPFPHDDVTSSLRVFSCSSAAICFE